jgi:predicted ATPase
VNELQRAFGQIEVDLSQTEKWHFLEAFLDSEPNRLGPTFRKMLYRQTQGHPLFTIELLRGLQDRGDVVQDREGKWIEGPALDWETLPARVEAVVAERVSRVDRRLREALQVASVEGEVFTAEVVARALRVDEREILRCMSERLDREHRLIRAESIQRLNGEILSHYRFRHILFQRYLYGNLDEVERVHLHEEVGTLLEQLHGAKAEVGSVAVQLALHFEKAGITEKAVRYLQKAGEEAVRLSAYPEAANHLVRALALLKSLPESRERTEKELALQVSLSMARMGGIPGPEWEEAVTRARELSHQMGKMSHLCRVIGEISILHYVRAEYRKARELAEEALSLAQQAADPLLILLGHWYLGFINFGLGEFRTAQAHLERLTALYDPEEHHGAFLLLRGSDAGVSALAYDASALWCLGYPDQAVKRSQEAMALIRIANHPFSSADAVCFGGCLLNKMRGNAAALKEDAEELVRLSRGMGFSSFLGAGTGYRGEALVKLGHVHEGIDQLREALTMMKSAGALCYMSDTLGALAESLAQTGELHEAAATLVEALAFVDETDERYYEAELHRLNGQLCLTMDDEAAAEASFLEAIEVARRQSARSWELRAALSLCRLWEKRGRREDARQYLAEVYDWFTEGFNTPDLLEARRLLNRIGSD